MNQITNLNILINEKIIYMNIGLFNLWSNCFL